MKFSVAPVLEYYGGQVTWRDGYSKMLCPFHSDSSPSASVNHTKQSFKCWVCDFGGDAVDIIKWREGCGYADAVAKAAQITGESDTDLRGDASSGDGLFDRPGTQSRNRTSGPSWRRGLT